MQYTLRGIPPSLDVAIRERARMEGKSLNQVAVEALADGLGLAGARKARRSVDDISGTWTKDAAVDKAIAEQDRVDPTLWK
jgi:hypothetical protein